MIYPSADKLESWGSKYSLVVLAAKRAKQIKSGAPPLIDTDSRNPLTIALEEIASGRIQCQVPDHDILPKTTQEAEVAELLAIPSVPAGEETADADTETAAVYSDDVELLEEEEEDEEEEEEEEQEVLGTEDEEDVEEEDLGAHGFEEEHIEGEAEEEHLDNEDDVEPEADAEPDNIAAPEEPKPKRGRKKKADVENSGSDVA